MQKSIIAILLLIFVGLHSVGCKKNQVSKAEFCKHFDAFITNCNLLEFPNQEDEQKKPGDIGKFVYFLDIAIDITINNIMNKSTTKTKSGFSPYRRKYIKVTDNGDFEIISSENLIFKYDPGHPDAIREVEKKGYVAYPDINIREEKENLQLLKQYYIYYVPLSNSDSKNDLGSRINEIDKYLN